MNLFEWLKFIIKIIMDVKNKQTIKLSFMNPTFIGLLIFMIVLISINCQQNKVLFNSSYFLVSYLWNLAFSIWQNFHSYQSVNFQPLKQRYDKIPQGASQSAVIKSKWNLCWLTFLDSEHFGEVLEESPKYWSNQCINVFICKIILKSRKNYQ